jgi:hypothetical protein
MNTWLPSFYEELTKIASESPKDQSTGKQLLQFGALGAATGPAIGGLSNWIQRGTFTPPDIKLKRWIPAQMVTGALLGGALPAVRHLIERRNDDALKNRALASKMLRKLAPEGPQEALNKIRGQVPPL